MGTTAEAWSKPSACDAWEVQDVVGHLVFVGEFFTDVTARGLKGDTSPSEIFRSIERLGSWEDFKDRTAFWAETAVDRRKTLGNQLLPTFAAQWDRFCNLIGSLIPEDWEKPCWRWGRTSPLSNYLKTLNES
jgi:hypothetical protein